jgi:hypothetical protein
MGQYRCAGSGIITDAEQSGIARFFAAQTPLRMTLGGDSAQNDLREDSAPNALDGDTARNHPDGDFARNDLGRDSARNDLRMNCVWSDRGASLTSLLIARKSSSTKIVGGV